jgi:hypothetical protein
MDGREGIQCQLKKGMFPIIVFALVISKLCCLSKGISDYLSIDIPEKDYNNIISQLQSFTNYTLVVRGINAQNGTTSLNISLQDSDGTWLEESQLQVFGAALQRNYGGKQAIGYNLVSIFVQHPSASDPSFLVVTVLFALMILVMVMYGGLVAVKMAKKTVDLKLSGMTVLLTVLLIITIALQWQRPSNVMCSAKNILEIFTACVCSW